MRTVNIKGLKYIGSGAFADVYRLSQRRIIKVYDYDPEYDAAIMAEEIELSMRSDHVLPVLDTAIAKKGRRRHYAVIKRYLPKRATGDDAEILERLLPRELRLDCHSDNVRKDNNGRTFLIDTQGNFAFKVLGLW